MYFLLDVIFLRLLLSVLFFLSFILLIFGFLLADLSVYVLLNQISNLGMIEPDCLVFRRLAPSETRCAAWVTAS